MTGSNNLTIYSDEEIINGLKKVLQAIIQRQPNVNLIVTGILPSQGKEKTNTRFKYNDSTTCQR